MADEKIYLDKGGLSKLWALIVAKFASKTHKHTVSDITDMGQSASVTIYKYTE